MLPRLAARFLTETNPGTLFPFMYTFGWKGFQAVRQHRRRLRQGRFFPPFVFISVTDHCNLHCQGCWAIGPGSGRSLPFAQLNRIVTESKAEGTKVFGILGGEPLLYPELIQLFRQHRDAYFLLFTNGTLITAGVAGELRQCGNVSPLISIEGKQAESDRRRGGRDVLARTLAGLAHCRRQRLVCGAAASICRSNLDELATEEFLQELIGLGVHYFWYYLYRPVGPDPAPGQTVTPEQIRRLRQFLVDVRCKLPLLVVDAYWDHLGQALCPAVAGLSVHIGPAGDLEPCPPIQLATGRAGNGDPLGKIVGQSEFLRKFRCEAGQATAGCILMEDPAFLKNLGEASGAEDSSRRGSFYQELSQMIPCPSHHQPGLAIPERSRVYRFAKKNALFGFGAYG